MNSFSTLKTLFCGSLLALSLVNPTQAGVSLDRTRIVLTGNENSASVNLKNTSPDIPFLAQSWVENENGQKISSPLVALPPLQRLDGAQKGVVRITKTAEVGLLPQDRESLFYLNVREIPPVPKQANVLQMAMQSRIKLFYRPSAIVPEKPGMVWQDQLVFKKQGNKFIVNNPTPYYITIISLSNKLNGEDSDKLTTFPGLMVAPKASLDIPVKTSNVNQFYMMYVNDYGGHPELKFVCQQDSCKVAPKDQQPKY